MQGLMGQERLPPNAGDHTYLGQVGDRRMHPQVPLDQLIGLPLLPVSSKVIYLHNDRHPSFLVVRTRLTELMANSMLSLARTTIVYRSCRHRSESRTSLTVTFNIFIRSVGAIRASRHTSLPTVLQARHCLVPRTCCTRN